jgi:predicted Fe-Mo cluster-binding NifX family protein
VASIKAINTLTAIPWNAGQISPHFSRAATILLLAQSGQVVEHFPNPAAAGLCVGKQALIALLQSKQVTRVLVRNIGQNMLASLLQLPLEIFQVPRGYLLEPGALDEMPLFTRLTHAQQGKPSTHARGS